MLISFFLTFPFFRENETQLNCFDPNFELCLEKKKMRQESFEVEWFNLLAPVKFVMFLHVFSHHHPDFIF